MDKIYRIASAPLTATADVRRWWRSSCVNSKAKGVQVEDGTIESQEIGYKPAWSDWREVNGEESTQPGSRWGFKSDGNRRPTVCWDGLSSSHSGRDDNHRGLDLKKAIYMPKIFTLLPTNKVQNIFVLCCGAVWFGNESNLFYNQQILMKLRISLVLRLWKVRVLSSNTQFARFIRPFQTANCVALVVIWSIISWLIKITYQVDGS